MKSIRVTFSRSSKPLPLFSWLIMLAERTDYSHCAIRMDDQETGLPVYWQASHTMVNCMGEEVWLAQERLVDYVDFQVTDGMALAARRFGIANLGKPYGALSILGLALVQLASLVGFRIHNPFREAGSTYVCSQFAAALLEGAAGVSLPENVNDVTPSDLRVLLKGLPQDLTGSAGLGSGG